MFDCVWTNVFVFGKRLKLQNKKGNAQIRGQDDFAKNPTFPLLNWTGLNPGNCGFPWIVSKSW